MEIITASLINKLHSDENYIKLFNDYKNNNLIDINDLKVVIENNKDLFVIWLKINIILYKYDFVINGYDKYNKKTLFVEDINNVMCEYVNFKDFYKSIIKQIIDFNILNNQYTKLLFKIYKRKIEIF